MHTLYLKSIHVSYVIILSFASVVSSPKLECRNPRKKTDAGYECLGSDRPTGLETFRNTHIRFVPDRELPLT